MAQLIGIDVGGTNTRVRVQSANGTEQATVTLFSSDWLSPTGLDDPAGAEILLSYAYELGATNESALAIGAHGCDSPAQILGFHAALAAHHSGPITVVNDAFLLAPAAGVRNAIGVIAGTGSIIVGPGSEGDLLTAGGFGWMIGDPGSAPGLTREAIIRALARHDDGLDPDPLGERLLSSYGAANMEELAWFFTHRASIHYWAEAAPLIFEAADAGSSDAATVIEEAGASLASDVARLLNRGVAAEAIVTAGGVMVNQPRLQDALATGLLARNISLPLHVLTDDPVAGAIELARRSVALPNFAPQSTTD